MENISSNPKADLSNHKTRFASFLLLSDEESFSDMEWLAVISNLLRSREEMKMLRSGNLTG